MAGEGSDSAAGPDSGWQDNYDNELASDTAALNFMNGYSPNKTLFFNNHIISLSL